MSSFSEKVGSTRMLYILVGKDGAALIESFDDYRFSIIRTFLEKTKAETYRSDLIEKGIFRPSEIKIKHVPADYIFVDRLPEYVLANTGKELKVLVTDVDSDNEIIEEVEIEKVS